MTMLLSAKERTFHSPALAIVETPAAPMASGLLWALAALLLGAIAWACIGEIEIVATAPGRLIPDGRVKVLQTIEPALVRAVHVREGQRVKEGDLLIELDPTLSQADLSSSQQRLQQNQQQMARLSMELKGQHLPQGLGGEAQAKALPATLTPGQLATIQAREAAYEAKAGRGEGRSRREDEGHHLGGGDAHQAADQLRAGQQALPAEPRPGQGRLLQRSRAVEAAAGGGQPGA